MAKPCTSPDRNCGLCPRLFSFRKKNRELFPDKHNAPVPAFGSDNPLLLVVGLAPGLRGANFSGRPFTGDYAGDLLYPTLVKFGFAKGDYGRAPDDGLALVETRITNAVRCVPPENKPTGDEIGKCLPFLENELSSFSRLKVIVALGTVAHLSVLKSLGLKAGACKFGHAKKYTIEPEKNLKYPVTLIDSYHCSRYNVNTGRLTAEMFENVIALAREETKRSKAA